MLGKRSEREEPIVREDRKDSGVFIKRFIFMAEKFYDAFKLQHLRPRNLQLPEWYNKTPIKDKLAYVFGFYRGESNSYITNIKYPEDPTEAIRVSFDSSTFKSNWAPMHITYQDLSTISSLLREDYGCIYYSTRSKAFYLTKEKPRTNVKRSRVTDTSSVIESSVYGDFDRDNDAPTRFTPGSLAVKKAFSDFIQNEAIYSTVSTYLDAFLGKFSKGTLNGTLSPSSVFVFSLMGEPTAYNMRDLEENTGRPFNEFAYEDLWRRKELVRSRIGKQKGISFSTHSREDYQVHSVKIKMVISEISVIDFAAERYIKNVLKGLDVLYCWDCGVYTVEKLFNINKDGKLAIYLTFLYIVSSVWKKN